LTTLATWVNLLLFGMALVASVAMAVAAWRGHSREGLAISIWNALNIPLGIHDALLQSYAINIESPYLMPYTVLGTFALFLLILFNRYTKAIEDVETSNHRLEARLAERERELEESHRMVRDIEQQKLLAVERQRLMRDMHDGMGASLMMALSVVEAQEDPHANDVALILRECVDDLKLTIDSLEPVESDLLLLLAAMRFRLEQRFTQSGLTLHWLVEDLPSLKWLDPSSALHVLRILQEVFTNVIKHARAKEIRVATGVSHSGVFVTVEDDGCGFAVEEALARAAERVPGRRGRGLPNLLNRAKLLEGTISWTKGGTRFELWLPLVRNGNT
jgi:signal transduction histidine kinase